MAQAIVEANFAPIKYIWERQCHVSYSLEGSSKSTFLRNLEILEKCFFKFHVQSYIGNNNKKKLNNLIHMLHVFALLRSHLDYNNTTRNKYFSKIYNLNKLTSFTLIPCISK